MPFIPWTLAPYTTIVLICSSQSTDARHEFPIIPQEELNLVFPLCFPLISFYLPDSLLGCRCCFDNCKHIVPFFTQKSSKCFSNVSSIFTEFNPNSLLSFQGSFPFESLSLHFKAFLQGSLILSDSPGVVPNFHLTFNFVNFFLFCIYLVYLLISLLSHSNLGQNIQFILELISITLIIVQCLGVAFIESWFLFINKLKCVILSAFSIKYLYFGCYKIILSCKRECSITFLLKLCLGVYLLKLCFYFLWTFEQILWPIATTVS